ncbi:MAG: spermidine synthase, partial [Nitrospirae bacterium]
MQKSRILKICLFATGLSGIVAEFILSTLASYLLGDTVLQWSIVISIMLFSMGIGSHITRYIKKHLLDKFICAEYGLSLLCSFSASLTYTFAAYIQCINLFIYTISCLIGLLIGLEIPLMTRINQEYESLRVNISSVMFYDYIGALFGGLL